MIFATRQCPHDSAPGWSRRKSPRAGHSVAVPFRVYAKCLDGGAATANARIEQALKNGG